VATDHRTEYPNLGRQFQVVTLLDTRPQGRFYNLLVDRNTGAVIEDVASLWRAEERARTEKYGKLQPALYERLQTMQDTDVVTVTIWAAAGPGQSLPEREVAAIATLADKYPEARAAVERGGKPMDVDDPVLAARIYREYVELVEGGAAPRVQPLVEALEAQGITIQTSEGLPAVTAALAKRDILLLAQRGDVGTIYLADGGHLQLLVDPATPTDQIASVGNSLQRLTGLALLGALLALGLVIVRQVVKKSEHSKNRIKRFVKIVGGLLGLLMLVLIVSRPQELELPFETIAQGVGFPTGRSYSGEEPNLLIITKPEEVDAPGLEVQFPSELAEQLRAIDYKRSFLIVVFRGLLSAQSPKYTIDILQVSRSGEEARLKVHFGEPRPDEIRLPAFSSPYHIIAVSKEGEWARDVRFVLEVDGQAVKEQTHFIP
jgi:hypothetical protein